MELINVLQQRVLLIATKFLRRNSLELINFVVRRKILTDFPQLTIHKPLNEIQISPINSH